MSVCRKVSFLQKMVIILFSTFLGTLHAQKSKESKKDKPVKLRVLPYINYSRTLDFQAGVVGMLMYRLNPNDTISPKSITGVIGIYSTNKSYLIASFNRWFLKEDTWRFTFFFGTGNLNSQTYVDDIEIPGFVDFNTDATAISFNAERRILKKWYGGLGLSYSTSSTAFEESDATTNNNNYGITLLTAIDKRDGIYYPKKGYHTKVKWNSNPTWFGNEESLSTATFFFNKYIGMRDVQDVLAFRGYVKYSFGSVNFERQVVIGGTDIRGYSEAKLRGDGVFAVQGEYRYNFSENWGLVGFAGLATLSGSINEDFNGKLYPGIGTGIRYTAFKSNNFNVGLDAAVGKDDWGLYFRIGEAF